MRLWSCYRQSDFRSPLLISIEPLIDMARTALNVNGAITTGILTNRFIGAQAEDAAPVIAAQSLQEN